MTAGEDAIRKELALLAEAGGGPIDLAEAALALAALALPLRQRDPYRRQIDAMASAVAGDSRDRSATRRAQTLARLLIDDGRFAAPEGDDEDADYANLMRVLETRCGLPVALGILWIAIGRRQGWPVEALSFPYRFLIRIGDSIGGRVIVDPATGIAVDTVGLRALAKEGGGLAAELKPELYAPASDREVLLRLLDGLKTCHLRMGRLRQAADTVEIKLTVAPELAAPWREMGLMQLRLGDTARAIAALEAFITRAPNSPVRRRALALVRELRQHPTN